MAVTPMRRRQGELLDHVLARLAGRRPPVPDWSLDDHRLTGLATGLTALTAHLWHDETLDPPLRAHLDEQAFQVAARVERFRALVPQVAASFTEAGVPAVFVKGAELIEGVWPHPHTRPMADVDLVVDPHRRALAGAALAAAGHRWVASTTYEDTYLAWGDGTAGRLDGESAAHNGRIEIHPGWREHLHGYDVVGFDVVAAATELDGRPRLGRSALTAHVLGHLGSCVVRAEVRAVNVVDVWWCAQAGADWDEVGRWLHLADPRLGAPALWLVDRVAPGVVPPSVTSQQLARLPSSARRVLDAAEPDAVWRDPTQRTDLTWRRAFTTHPRELARVADQAVWAGGPRRPSTLVARVRR